MRIEKFCYSDSNEMHMEEKSALFHELEPMCQSLAERLGSNLLMDTDDHAGWIIFVCDTFSFKNRDKQELQHLANLADEITIQPSVNTGDNSPTDIDGAAQLIFWFDFISYDE